MLFSLILYTCMLVFDKLVMLDYNGNFLPVVSHLKLPSIFFPPCLIFFLGHFWLLLHLCCLCSVGNIKLFWVNLCYLLVIIIIIIIIISLSLSLSHTHTHTHTRTHTRKHAMEYLFLVPLCNNLNFAANGKLK